MLITPTLLPWQPHTCPHPVVVQVITRQASHRPAPTRLLTMRAAAAAAALVLMLASLCLSYSCVKEGSILLCTDFPAYFDSGVSSLVFSKKVKEINSTMFRSENLTSVTRFRLEKVGVTAIAVGAFGSLLGLRTLFLDANMLTEVNPNWLGAPDVLTELDFSENCLETVTKQMLDGLVNLSKLRLNRNKIRTVDQNSFESQRELKELDLSGNMMTCLSPLVFSSLMSTKIRLDMNPWNCSCGAEGFVSLLEDLQSTDRLERPMEVKCGSPPFLSGRPVLNVSVCESSPPPDYPSATPPDQPKRTSAPTTTSTVAVSTRWRHNSTSTIEPTFASASTPSEIRCPSRPPANTLCTLATVIGVLCLLLLLLLLCVLAVMRRKKLSIKSVSPARPGKEKKKPEEDGWSTSSPGGCENGDPEEPERTKTRSFTLGRAKSAHAVILTSPFCPGNQVTFQMEAESKEGLNLGNPVMTIRENLTNVSDVEPRCQRQEDEKLQPQCPNTDVAPYLSIGSNPRNRQPSRGPGGGAQRGKVMGRISTWPPTAAQWQARCKLNVQEDATVWTTYRNEMFSNEEARIVEPPSAPGHSKTPSSTESKTESEKIHDVVQDMIHVQTTGIPSVCEADAHSTSRLTQDRNRETSRTTQIQNLQEPGPTANTNPVQHSGEIDGKTNARRKPKPSAASGQPPGTGAAGSKAPSGGASPDDETLLSGNEYVCMDLLHEVVQNNGRWTRDRWKQVHANRQRR